MKPETAAAIAKKIGMTTEYWPGASTNSGEVRWQDGAISVPLDELDHYLASGDRPLRVLEAIKPAYNIEITCDDDRWRIWIHPDKYAEAETLAAAILACAEALEEGR